MCSFKYCKLTNFVKDASGFKVDLVGDREIKRESFANLDWFWERISKLSFSRFNVPKLIDNY